ncbi:MAG: ABC transporter substrate-binding protein [Vulcanimicrobiaceae bacterium]
MSNDHRLQRLTRRDVLATSAAFGASMLAGVPALAGTDQFTEWGYRLPYKTVSKKSLDWLKSRGWLPLTIGHFADLPGYAGSYAVMRDLNLLAKRGLDAKFVSFLSGPPILEAFIGGHTQATGYGDLPFWTTIARGNPAVVYGITAPNYDAAMFVPNNSPLHSIQDFKSQSKPVVIGTLLGSFLEFYILAAAKATGLEVGKHYTLAGVSLRDAQYMPGGLDAVVTYDPFSSVMRQKKVGREIDNVFPYYFNTGYDFVKRDIHENAPDVVQALADAMLEATLYTRYDINKAVEMYWSNPQVQSIYPKELFLAQTQQYVTLYKPTYRYPHVDFWTKQDVGLIELQFQKKRIPKSLTIFQMKSIFEPKYMASALSDLGFSIPSRPVFLPKGWKGSVSNPPYPPYDNFTTLKEPQNFPQAGDLRRAWTFAGKTYRA